MRSRAKADSVGRLPLNLWQVDHARRPAEGGRRTNVIGIEFNFVRIDALPVKSLISLGFSGMDSVLKV